MTDFSFLRDHKSSFKIAQFNIFSHEYSKFPNHIADHLWDKGIMFSIRLKPVDNVGEG